MDIEKLLSSNVSDDISTGIVILSELFTEGDSILRDIHFNKIYPNLISTLCNQKNEELLDQTSYCIVRSDRYMNSNQNPLLNNQNPSQILQSIFSHLSNPAFKKITKVHILNALFHLVLKSLNQNTIYDFSQYPFIETIIQYYDQFDSSAQLYFHKMLNHIWSFYGQFQQLHEYRDKLFGRSKNFVNFLISLKKKLGNETSVLTLQLIINIMNTYQIFGDNFEESLLVICASASNAGKTEITDHVKLLNTLFLGSDFKDLFLQGIQPIAFNEIVSFSNSPEYIEIILTFSVSFMPKPNIDSIDELYEPEKYLWCNEKNINETFIQNHSKEMIGICEKIYFKNPDALKLVALKTMSIYSFYYKNSPSDKLLYNLSFDVKEKQYAFYVLIIVSNLIEAKKKLIFRTDFFNSLQTHQFESESLNYSYGNYIDTKLEYEEYELPEDVMNAESLNQISKAIQNKTILFFDFLSDSNDLINICWDLLPISSKEDLEVLVNFLFDQGLSFLPLPPVPKDPLPLIDYNELMEKSYRLKANASVFNAELYAPIIYTEILLNGEILEEIVKIEIMNNEELKKMFHDYDQVFNRRYSMAIIAHELKVQGFKRYMYKMDDNLIDPYLYLLKSMLDNFDDMDNFFKTRNFRCIEITDQNKEIPTSSYLHKRKERMNKDDPIPNMNQFVSNLFELLNEIYLQDPSINLINRNFLKRIMGQLSSPVLTIGILSPCSKMMIKYPFLFPFEDRFFFFKVLVSELSIVTNLYLQRFKKENPVNKPSHNWHMKVSRNNVFNDGIHILRRFAKYKVFLEFSFDGETGVGTGPNREFFSLMSKEFCLKSRGMWRSNDTDDSFSFSEKGLFPSCTADDELFYSLGLFVAKAIDMDIIIDIPFNLAFFDLVFGRKVNIDHVDQQYSKSLENPENLIGLTFVYPVNGQIDVEMIPNGKNIEVDMSNVNEYIKLFNDFTFGSKIKSKIEAFINGFNEVFDIETLNMFSSSEILRIVCGEGFNLTREILQKHVKIGSGFSQNSDQIRFLFDIILEMDYNQKILFFQFITGSSRLPIGGLAAFYPPLTVARRVLDNPDMTDDDPLPTVLTCTHYFKLPAYSTKEIMKEKLMKAVMEGRENFTQT